jgi:anaerobic magnesium-protoporphyrin IX monomethyl ester cyclase
MKTLLVVPTHQYRAQYPSFLSITDFPVGFAYLASALKKAGHQVYGLNPNNAPGFESSYQMLRAKFTESIKSTNPDLICTGGLCTDFAFLKDVIRLSRELAPHTPIVLGGGIVTHDASIIFQALRPDFCISGEAEESLVQLVHVLEQGSKAYDSINNLGYWENQTARFTPLLFRYPDLDQRAFPDYEPFGIKTMLDDYSLAARYLYRYSRLKPRPMPIVTGRGCPFSCTFCVHNRKETPGGLKYRARKMDEVVKEISQLYNQHEFNILLILDELFAVNKKRLRDFSEAILQGRREQGWDFDWSFQTHASASFDRETLAIAREAGCYFFSYGLESASPRVLVSMNKRSKQSQIQQAILDAEKARIGFGGNFIFGDVAETADTARETMSFFDKHCRDIHIFFGWIRPYPGSLLFDRCVERKDIPDKLKYYECIDEKIFNMTKGFSIIWIPWFMVLGYYGNLFLWVKSIKARSCKLVPELNQNPIVLANDTPVYEISAACPFCGLEFAYREFLGQSDVKRTSSARLSFAAIQNKIAKYKKKNWLVSLSFFVASLVSIVVPLFRLLSYFRDRKNVLKPSIVTGCPHCNKRVRIYVEIEKTGLQV